MNESQARLVERARTAALRAYAPYSRFRVGAALVAGGDVYTGANVENASTGLSTCAERVALANARMHTDAEIQGIAVACIDARADDSGTTQRNLCMPCGACRQWLAELAPGAWVAVDGQGVFTLQDLLPSPFRLAPPAPGGS